METGTEISSEYGHLKIRTPGRYAMELAVDILEFLDSQPYVRIKNTGWKNGYGLEVAVWLPIISSDALEAEISTDGEAIYLRRSSGVKSEFSSLCEKVQHFIENRNTSS